jgi:subtilisin-like proprotein convertase family protein
MKKILISGMALVAMAGVASATLITETFNPTDNTADEIAIPQGNLAGIANSLSVSDPGGAAIEDVSVNLDISGGYDGDLYGYLVFQPSGGGSALLEVLLNQIGKGPGNPFGTSTAGMNVTLSDSGGSSIHNASGANLFPVGAGLPPVYTPDSTTPLDGTFGGVSANGTWTLFLANLSEGGGTSTLVSWDMGITVVPEPVTWALAGFAGMLAVAGIRRYRNVMKARA